MVRRSAAREEPKTVTESAAPAGQASALRACRNERPRGVVYLLPSPQARGKHTDGLSGL